MQATIEPAAEDRIAFAPALLNVALAKRTWYSYETTLKRVIDIALTVAVLVATIPLWLAIAVVIKLDSPGPVLFVQERVGRGGVRFPMLKFRSMYADAERRFEEVRALNEVSGPVFKLRRDPRITRVGRFLRRSSLDELPQLINVLQGHMSLVGPRPPIPDEVDHYRPSDLIRLTVKPGLTCWWQIRGRSECDFDTWMRYDQTYVAGLSLLTDVRILLGTIRAVIRGGGAY
jgi:lipopolysaccharide/colanic/teichoic acid biosynthesis glycosyltransferase